MSQPTLRIVSLGLSINPQTFLDRRATYVTVWRRQPKPETKATWCNVAMFAVGTLVSCFPWLLRPSTLGPWCLVYGLSFRESELQGVMCQRGF